MPAVKTGMTPPPMPGMPAPMQPMGGMPPAQNPFAPMPPMPLAGMPPPPMPMPQGQPMPQTAQGQQMGSTAGRRRRFGDALEGMLGRNQGIGAVSQQQRPMPQMMPQQQMVAPNTPMMRTPSPRPMAMGGEVDIFGYDDGGMVPRQTMIGDQPHMLAYINPQEADLLKDLGGSGEPGPGGIPAYRDLDADMYAGSKYGSTSNAGTSSAKQSFTNVHTGETFSSASDLHDSYGFSDDDNNNSSSGSVGSVNTSAKDADLGVGGSSTTVTADQLSSGTGTTTYNTDDGGSVTVATGSSIDDILSSASSDDGGSSVVDVYAPSSVYTPPPPVYTDRRGNTYSSQAEADAADRAFASQLALASASVRDDAGRLGFGVSDDEVDYLAGLRMDDGKVQPGFVPSSMLGGAGPAGLYSGIGGIGSGPASGVGVGVTPAPITSPDISTDVSRPDVGPEAQYDVDDLFGTGLGSDILSLETPSAATMYPYDVPASVLAAQLRGGPLTPGMDLPDAGVEGDDDGEQLEMFVPTGGSANVPTVVTTSADQPLTDDDMGLPSGPYTPSAFPSGRSEADIFQPPQEADVDATKEALMNAVKQRVSEVEGTSDEGGYDRLLGQSEKNKFSNQKPLSEMTVAEAIEFGTGDEYRNYSKQLLGRGADELPSTPMGKYQILGSTLDDLVKRGVVDPNAKFDAATQERLGSYLIENRGLFDTDKSREDFVTSLGQEFEGIKDKGYDGTTAGQLSQGLGTTQPTTSGDSEAARMAKLYDRGLGEGDDPRRANIAVNAAEAKYLQNLLKAVDDPNILEQILGRIGSNLTLGMVDFNELTRDQAQKVLDAYRDTGSFVYDTEGNAIDLKTVEDLEKLEALSAGEGQTPAVIGVRDKDGNIVSSGPNIANTPEGPVVVDDIFDTLTTTGDDDDTTTTTTDDTGHKDGVCNNPDYVYNPETDKCEPKKEEETDGDLGSPITTAITPRSFDEVLRSVVVPAPDIPSISTNIRPMQGGGMAGLNRAADNFLKALAG